MNRIIKLGFVAMILLLQTAYASSGKEGGGGDGYVASFVQAADAVALWLQSNGANLNPAVKAGDFLNAIDPNKIMSTDMPLIYKGQPRDAFYDSSSDTIEINRARWSSLQPDSPEQELVAAHEIFRRMGIEGDNYEITSQMTIFSCIQGNCGTDPAAPFRSLFAQSQPLNLSSLGTGQLLLIDLVDNYTAGMPCGSNGIYIDTSQVLPRGLAFCSNVPNSFFLNSDKINSLLTYAELQSSPFLQENGDEVVYVRVADDTTGDLQERLTFRTNGETIIVRNEGVYKGTVSTGGENYYLANLVRDRVSN